MSRLRAALAAGLIAAGTVITIAAAPPAAAGGSCHQALTDRRTNAVTTEGICFVPSVARVDVGEPVTWSVGDGIAHTVSTSSGTWGGDLNIGGAHRAVFDRPGVYPYFCQLHFGMVGTIVVGDGGLATRLASATADGPIASTSSVPWPALLVVLPVGAIAYVAGTRRRREVPVAD
jgi:plastocyanin